MRRGVKSSPLEVRIGKRLTFSTCAAGFDRLSLAFPIRCGGVDPIWRWGYPHPKDADWQYFAHAGRSVPFY
jgi:hypothetical protein